MPERHGNKLWLLRQTLLDLNNIKLITLNQSQSGKSNEIDLNIPAVSQSITLTSSPSILQGKLIKILIQLNFNIICIS